MRIGIVGTGKICDIYLKNIKERFTSNTVTAGGEFFGGWARGEGQEEGGDLF